MNSTGNQTVDKLGQMNITGNIVPMNWFHTICYSNGKPCLNAIMILSDIVYWYRPREIRDESTGSVIRYEKRFKADILQRNYQEFASQLGLSKKQIKEAFDLLESLGIVFRDFRTLEIGGRAMNNVLFIGLNADVLDEYTNDPDSHRQDPSRGTPSQHESGETPDFDGPTLPTSKSGAVSPKGETNTEITTENTHRDLSYPIHLKLGYTLPPSDRSCHVKDGMDTMEPLRELVKQNLEYEAMLKTFRYDSDRRRFTEIVELICDVISQTQGTVRVGREEKPVNVVKSVFMKLTYEHVQYVMDSLDKTTSEIKNIRSYLITALYRAPQTMDNRIAQQVTHDTLTMA